MCLAMHCKAFRPLKHRGGELVKLRFTGYRGRGGPMSTPILLAIIDILQHACCLSLIAAQWHNSRPFSSTHVRRMDT